jgi:hypothetical protein
VRQRTFQRPASVWAAIVALVVVGGATASADDGREAGRSASGVPRAAVLSPGPDKLGYGSTRPIRALRPDAAPGEKAEWASQELAASLAAKAKPGTAISYLTSDSHAPGNVTPEALATEVRRRLGLPERYPLEVRTAERGGRRAVSVIVGPASR